MDEMLKFSSVNVHQELLRNFNQMLRTSDFDLSCHDSVFQMLPNDVDLSSVSNWRPIVILHIIYKFVCDRLFFIIITFVIIGRWVGGVSKNHKIHDLACWELGESLKSGFLGGSNKNNRATTQLML